MQVFEGVDESTWWEVARSCEYATFFHTPLWHRLAERALAGHRDISFSARAASGVRAVVPLLKTTGPLGPWFGGAVSTFAGCYGGPIADGPLTESERTTLLEAAGRAAGHVVISGNPLNDEPSRPEGFDRTEDSSQLLRLDAPFEALLSRFSKGHRSGTTKGRRAGVIVRRAESLDDYRSYHEIYQAALDRWGDRATSRYPWKLFETAHRLAADHRDRIVLWLGELDERVVAGALVFYWNRHAVYWHGAADDEGRSASATNVVIADAIADAADRGFDWFDFNPSGGHEGVEAFKRRFGCQRMSFARLSRRRTTAAAAQRLAAAARRFARVLRGPRP